MAGGKADLVAVGGIAGGGSLGNPALGQLPGQSLVYRDAGIAAAGKPHGLMYIGPPGQGVPDAPADAGGRTAEGLDLRGVVMSLVFEHQKPGLRFAVHLSLHPDGTGVDLLALVQFREQAPLFQRLGTDGGNVHQGLGASCGFFRTVDLFPGG